MTFGNTVVSGKIIDEKKQPLSQVKIVAYKKGVTEPSAIAITTDTGLFKMFLDSGFYTFQVASPYYTLASNKLTVNGEKELQLEDLIVIAKRRFKEQVLNEVNQKPIAGCKVKAYLKRSDIGYDTTEVIDETMTDEKGEFELLLFPSVYIVTFENSSFEPKPVEVIVE